MSCFSYYKFWFQLLLTIIVSFIFTETKVCSKQDGLNRIKYFCCTEHFFDKVDDKCKACHIGFVRSDKDPEESCVPCSDGWFGNKCLEKCSCQIEQCDHVNGCVTQELTTIKTNEMTTKGNSTYVNTTMLESSPVIQGTISEAKDTFSITIYILCAAVVCLGLSVVIYMKSYLSKRSYNTNTPMNEEEQVTNEEQNGNDVAADLQRTNSVYDLIDEDNL